VWERGKRLELGKGGDKGKILKFVLKKLFISFEDKGKK
jgi:hypothetical protein